MNDIIDMNLPQRLNLRKIAEELIRRPHAAMKIVGSYKDDEYLFGILVKYLKLYGIGVHKLSNGIAFVYWVECMDFVDNILGATLAELPELLTSEESEVRLLATHRLEELNK